MTDIWSFLLQTLTAAGAAVLLWILKRAFRDKLPPRWQFAAWGVLALVLLVPAGLGGRYVLLNWQIPVELLRGWVGDYGTTRVMAPFPVITGLPRTIPQWIFFAYVLGVMVSLTVYLLSYLRLRTAVRGGSAPDPETADRVTRQSQLLGLRPCRIRCIPGLPSAFVCGILRPVLVLPGDRAVDDKVLLHELLHLKYHDTLWTMVICILKSLHWCDPILVWCAGLALEDLEARCDQAVLERLEGEERRDYGQLLLSMSNDRFPRTPGTTCIHNGGRKLKARIETIARFKRYPRGMELVSVCVIAVLALSLTVGVQATPAENDFPSIALDLAIARSTPCTTAAGAFDTYAKAVLRQDGRYYAMCAPADAQEALARELSQRDGSIFPSWDSGLPCWPKEQEGYYLYGLKKHSDRRYQATLVVQLAYPPEGREEAPNMMYLATQELLCEKEAGRWVVVPLGGFTALETLTEDLGWGCLALPGTVYAGATDGFRVEVTVQTVHCVDNVTLSDDFFLSSTQFDTTPKPHAQFDIANQTASLQITHLGSQTERNSILRLGLSVAPVRQGQTPPEQLHPATGGCTTGSSSDGQIWESHDTEIGWGPTMELSGGGSGMDPEELPQYYVADLYVNDQLHSHMELWEVKAHG